MDCTRHRIDPHSFHLRQVNDNAAIADSTARYVVTTSAHCYQQIVVPGEIHRVNNVRYSRTADYQGRIPVDHGVEEGARFIVALIAAPDYLAAQPGLELFDSFFGQHCFLALGRSSS